MGLNLYAKDAPTATAAPPALPTTVEPAAAPPAKSRIDSAAAERDILTAGSTAASTKQLNLLAGGP